jgi:hypothetical protein
MFGAEGDNRLHGFRGGRGHKLALGVGKRHHFTFEMEKAVL